MKASLPTLLVAACFTAACSDSTALEPAPVYTGLEQVQATAVSARNVRITWSAKTAGTVVIERALYNEPFQEVARKRSDHGRFLDLALQPETGYRYRLALCDEDVCFTHADLPELVTPETHLPRMDVTVPADGTLDDVVVFGLADVSLNLQSESIMAGVARDGTILWEYYVWEDGMGPVSEVQLMPDGTLLAARFAYLTQMDWDGTEQYRYTESLAHHDFDPTSDGRLILMTFDRFEPITDFWVVGDGVEIIDPSGRASTWRWLGRDAIPLTDYNEVDIQTDLFGYGADWTHGNAVTFDEEDAKIYVNIRNLNRLYCLDYPSGEVLWVMGDGGDFGEGLWSHSHDPCFTAKNRFLLFDNGTLRPGASKDYSRIIEVEFDAAARRAEIVWEYRETPDFFAFAQGAVHVQGDGNIFVTDGINGRIFEITRDKRTVWEMRLRDMHWTYKAITVPKSVFSEW